MSNRGVRFFKRFLAYVLAFILVGVVYISTAFIMDHIFRWLGDESGVGWGSTLAGCLFCSVAVIIIDIRRVKRGGEDRSAEIIKTCRKIITMTTLMFGGLVFLEWLIMHEPGTEFIFQTERYLPLALSVAIFDALYEKRKERLVEKDERRLVVATEVDNIQLAEAISTALDSEGIVVMLVEKGSPIYVKGSGAPYQIQVTNGDLAKAKEIIARVSA